MKYTGGSRPQGLKSLFSSNRVYLPSPSSNDVEESERGTVIMSVCLCRTAAQLSLPQKVVDRFEPNEVKGSTTDHGPIELELLD